jgi:Zn-dependent peptidase ImmA (M78 family)
MDAFLRGDLTAIVVDHDFYMNEKFSNRLRFSFAQELGHFFLHQYAYSQFDFASPYEWRNFIQNIPEKEYGNFEWQANEFAGRLLVPYVELRKALDETLSRLGNSNLREYLAKDPDAVLSGISPSICRHFGVSSGVIETRIRREGMWPPL